MDAKTPTRRETSYGIQNLRYVFQIITDAVAIRQVVYVNLLVNKTFYFIFRDMCFIEGLFIWMSLY